jgi:hypothetical protein
MYINLTGVEKKKTTIIQVEVPQNSSKIWQLVDITKYMTYNFKEGNAIYFLTTLLLATIVLLLTDE